MAEYPLHIKTRIRRRDQKINWTDADEYELVALYPELKDPDREYPEGLLDPPSTNGHGKLAEMGIDPSVVPDLGPDLTPSDQLQPVLDSIDILEAHRRWGKGDIPKVGSRTESIMIRCPNHDHEDKNPSAWISTSKQLWSCGPCEGRGPGLAGGDKYDLAAKFFNIDYRNDPKLFPELRRRMAEAFGAVITRSPGGQELVAVPEPAPVVDGEGGEATAPPTPTPPQTLPVHEPIPPEPIEPAEPVRPNLIIMPSASDEEVDDAWEKDVRDRHIFIDWEPFAPKNTFLDEWLTSTTVDDLAHEYYFWSGMQALAAAAGIDVVMLDYKPVKPNLFVCHYGRTGSGKSRSLDPFQRLLEEALPFNSDPHAPCSGVKMIPSPGSAEALMRSFQHEVLDPSTNKVMGLSTVNGILRIEEFASFIARGNRTANPLKETLIELYDIYKRAMTHYSLSGGSIRIESPYCQMVTTTQPAAIHSYLRRSDADSGFMNRWVFATGLRRRERIPHGGVSIEISDSVKYLQGLRAWCGSGHQMKLEGDALKVWEKFYHKYIGPLYDKLDESMFSRIDLTLKKVIILMSINERQAHPTASIVERAVTLFDYLMQTYSMFSTDLSLTETEECQNRIIKIIEQYTQSTKQPITLREIVKRVGGKYTREIIERSLKTLEMLDLVQVSLSQGTRGPATKRYLTNAV